MILRHKKRRSSSSGKSIVHIDRRASVEQLPEQANKYGRYNLAIYFTISLSVLLSILLILIGIFNAQKTSEVADASISRSLNVQRLNESLEIHQETMNRAVEYAITSGEPYWRNNYENSFTKLTDNLSEVGQAVELPLIGEIHNIVAETVAIERQLFELIASSNQTAAFTLLASDEYQDKKVQQEQQSLTLRATLSKESSEIIETLKTRLKRTTIALTSQLVLLIAIWSYVVHVVRKWQKTQAKHNKELEHLAHFDALTGIGNRTLFQLKLSEAFSRANATNTSVALVLMDIDHFKDINDSLGHEMGDELLKYFAEELSNSCRDSDTVVRLGGDEFAIIVSDLQSDQYASVFCKKILDLFNKSVVIKDQPIKTGTSIGISIYPKDADQAEGLLRKADLALYEAKRAGRAVYQFFNDNIETMARNKIEMLEAIQNAIDNNEFELAYQPIIDMNYQEVIGVETLLRWHSPTRGMINPAEFIGLAEDSGLIVPIGTWVLRTACAQQLVWCTELGQSLSLAVNLSGVQFHEKNLQQVVENALIDTGMENEKLVLEITESTLMETEGGVIEKLNSLRSLGVKLAIDDFGTGYSSLAYLKRFPINYLKLDKAFVNDLPEDSRDVAIARSVITMAHELGVEVIAEGIETENQFNFLAASGCDRGQGYYLGKPMSSSQFVEYMRRSRMDFNTLRTG